MIAPLYKSTALAWLLATSLGAGAGACANKMNPFDEDANEGASAADEGASSGDVEGDDPGDPVPIVAPPDAGVVGASALLAEVETILAGLKTTHYQHASNIDVAKGIYEVDCSGFTNFALGVGVSDAYGTFETATRTRPVAADYVSFISGLIKPSGRWHRVTQVADLVPGDILAWLIPKGVKSSDTGHVMIVEKGPMIVGNQAAIAIVDSTDTGHGDVDPRLPKGPSGIGRGTTVVTMAADGTANGYRWSTDSDSAAYVTEVAMAHLD